MLTEGPSGGILPADFDKPVSLLARRHYPFAAGQHRRHRRVLTRALPEIEIRRGDDLARIAKRIIPGPAIPRLPGATTSSLLQRDDIRRLECFAGLPVARRDHRIRSQVTGQHIPFELTVTDAIPAVLRLAVDRHRCALGKSQERLSTAIWFGADAGFGDSRG